MKRIVTGMLVLLMLALAGCGGEVSVTATVPIPEITISPVLSGLHYGWTSGGTILAGTVDFTALSADLDTMTIVVSNDYGREVSRTTTDLRGYQGSDGGFIDFAIDTISFPWGRYTFTLYVVDWLGHYSNPVYGDFII